MGKAEQSQATVAAITAIARRHFSSKGYAATATEDIVREAGVTRGALYHHFNGKHGLFEAVFEAVLQDISADIMRAAEAESDPWRGFAAGCDAFLESAANPAIQRIVIVDAPAVISWERWRELDTEHGSQLLREGVQELHAAGLLETNSIDAVTFLLVGAMNEAAMWIARSEEPQAALVQAQENLRAMINGLRKS